MQSELKAASAELALRESSDNMWEKVDQLTPSRYSPYRFLQRNGRGFRADTPLTLTYDEVKRLRSLGDPIDLDEVRRIYLSLSRLLSAHVAASFCSSRAQAVPQHGRVVQDAVHHRHCRFGCGWEIHDCAYPERASGTLAIEPEGRSRDDRRFSLPLMRSCASRT